MNSNKKVSVVISVLNGERTIKKCIQSIIDQQYDDWELIIIDGGSIDSTVSIIKEFSSDISYWISERDTGIYNAWNKAIVKAKGEWLCFIGSDDILLPYSLRQLTELAVYPDINFVCSRVMMVDENGLTVGAIGKSWSFKNFDKGLGIVHCGALHHRTLFENNNLFDESYKIAGDFEFLVRVGKRVKAAFLNEITVHMCNKGVSRSSVNKVILETSRALYESKDFKKTHGINYFLSAHIRSIIRKIVFRLPFGNQLFALRNKN